MVVQAIKLHFISQNQIQSDQPDPRIVDTTHWHATVISNYGIEAHLLATPMRLSGSRSNHQQLLERRSLVREVVERVLRLHCSKNVLVPARPGKCEKHLIV